MADAARFIPSSSSSYFPFSASSTSFFVSSSSSSSLFFLQPSSSSSSLFLPSSSSFSSSTPYILSSQPESSFLPAASSSSYIPPQTITLPLTTIFTPPADCTKAILSTSWTSLGSDSHSPELTDAYKLIPTCYPTSFILSNYVAVYSPGVCPEGFSTAEQRELANHTQTVTFATCCPTNASLLKTAQYGLCHSSVVPAVTVIDSVAQSTYTAYNKYAIVVYPITVGWQSSDLPNLPTPAIAANNNSRSGATAAASHSGAAMSSGTKAGVSVGVAAGAIAITAVLIWMAMRVRRRRKQPPSLREVYRDDFVGAMGGQRQLEKRRGPSEMGSSEPLRPELESNSFAVYR